MKRTYRNLFTQEEEKWDPDERCLWAVGFKLGMNGKYTDSDGRNRELGLCFGYVNAPHKTEHAAQADMASLVIEYPWLADRFVIVKLPCAMCHREDMIDVPDSCPSTDLVEETRRMVRQNFHLTRDAWKRKHGLSTIYF